MHFKVRVGVFNCQQILAKISFVVFDIVLKKKQIKCGLAWHSWNSTDLGLIDMFLINLNAEIVACMLSFRKSRHKPNLESTSKYCFSPDLGEKMASFWACACKLSWTLLSHARVQPLYGAGRKESSGTGLQQLRLSIISQKITRNFGREVSFGKQIFSSVFPRLGWCERCRQIVNLKTIISFRNGQSEKRNYLFRDSHSPGNFPMYGHCLVSFILHPNRISANVL